MDVVLDAELALDVLLAVGRLELADQIIKHTHIEKPSKTFFGCIYLILLCRKAQYLIYPKDTIK